jgi:CPA2 family monovalent cation:H+ antiporter-2
MRTTIKTQDRAAEGSGYQDFAIVMFITSVIAFIFYKIKQPRVIGHIAAGCLLGHIPCILRSKIILKY